MANPVTKAISANDVKNGNAVSHVSKGGIIKTLAPPILDSSTGYDMDGRLNDPRYYKGDNNGLQTTVTYSITSNNDDGYWRTSKTYAHDPFANNLYSNAAKMDGDFIIGFDRY